MGTSRARRAWSSAIAGAWIRAEPRLVHAAGTVETAFVALGALMVVGSVWSALDRPADELRRGGLVALFGVCVTASPWFLGFTTNGAETWLTAPVGLILRVGLGLWVALRPGAKETSGSTAAPPAPRKTA